MLLLPKDQKGLTPIITLILILVAVAGSFLVFNSLNKPAQIKERSNIIQPLFQDLKHSVEAVGDHLKDTPTGTDVDSSERYTKKGKGLNQTAGDNLDKIKSQIEKLNFSETSEYKKKLDEYIKKSAELIQYEKDDIKLGEDYLDPERDYEDLTKSISGVSNYMYSDPARYVKEVGAAVEKEDQIIKDFKKLNEDGLHKKTHEAFIKKLEAERELLDGAKAAVESRDNSALTKAIKKYSTDSQDIAKEANRYSDESKEKYNNVISDLKSLADKIENDYNQLKDKFKF